MNRDLGGHDLLGPVCAVPGSTPACLHNAGVVGSVSEDELLSLRRSCWMLC